MDDRVINVTEKAIFAKYLSFPYNAGLVVVGIYCWDLLLLLLLLLFWSNIDVASIVIFIYITTFTIVNGIKLSRILSYWTIFNWSYLPFTQTE